MTEMETTIQGPGASAWTPPAEMTTHAGEPIPADADFVYPPPPEIGEVVSAFTSLRQGVKPRSLGGAVRWLLLVSALLIGLVEILRRTVWDLPPGDVGAVWFGIGVIMFIAFLICLAVCRFRHRCSYVGKLGFVRYRLAGSRHAAPRTELFLFASAEYLKTHEVRQYVNGVYSGTTYKYSWHDGAHAELFKLHGQHRGNKGPPKPHDPYHLAVAAEVAWSQCRFDGLQAEVERNGSVTFPILERFGKIRAVNVGPGFVEFAFKEGAQRVPVEDFGKVTVAEGTFTFKHKDTKWFSGKGKFSFSYGSIGNAQLFLLCLTELAEISLT